MYKQTMKDRVIHKKFWMGSFINRILNSCVLYFPTLTILGGPTVFVRKGLASLEFMLVFSNKSLFIT